MKCYKVSRVRGISYKKIEIKNKIKRRKAHWIGHIWRRNGLLKYIIDEKIEVKQSHHRPGEALRVLGG